MVCLISIIIAVFLTIANANNWFIVPVYCIYIFYGITAISFLIAILNFILIGIKNKQISKSLDKKFGRF